jgi:hypothetical protein
LSEVYFIQGYDGGPIKIGRARDPRQRVRDLQIGSPVPLDLVCTIEGDERLESAFHKVFADDRLHGEWFAPSVGLEALIENLIAPDPTDPESVAFRERVATFLAKTPVPPANTRRRRTAPTPGG